MRVYLFCVGLLLLASCYVTFGEVLPILHTQSQDLIRTKRQQSPDPADQFFDNVFQIPISTLNAVNELIKSTRPVIRRARERIQQQYQTWQQNNGNGRPRPVGRDAQNT